jgi:hypothetical protein
MLPVLEAMCSFCGVLIFAMCSFCYVLTVLWFHYAMDCPGLSMAANFPSQVIRGLPAW